MTDDYAQIAQHYEKCFEKYGPTNKGVDWPSQTDLNKRFRVMTDIIKVGAENRDADPLWRAAWPSLLDFGCGTGLLLAWLAQISYQNPTIIRRDGRMQYINYAGCDLSDKFINFCKEKYPDTNFFQIDAIKNPEQLPKFDFIVMNGVLTMKPGLSFEEMWAFTQKLLTTVFEKANQGVAFNVMSKQVDWERDDLFHLPLDLLASFLTKNLTRNFVIRNDYGLYEYTVYLYKEPVVK